MDKDKISLWGYDFCVTDNCAYVFHGNMNALFKIDLQYDTVTYMTGINFETFRRKALYLAMRCFDNRIYFFPYNAENIACYDIKTNQTRKILKFDGKIVDVIGSGRYVYLMPPKACQPIIKFDMQTESCIKEIYINGDSKELQNYFNDTCYMEEGVYAGIVDPANILCIFDSRDDSARLVNILNADDIYSSIEYYDGYIYAMGSRKYSIAKINPKCGEIVEKYMLFDDYGRFVGRIQDEIIVDMVRRQDICTFNCISKEKFRYLPESERNEPDSRYYQSYYGIFKRIDDFNVCYLNRYDNTLTLYCKNKKSKKIKLEISYADITKLRKYVVENMETYEDEGDLLRLDDYLEYL